MNPEDEILPEDQNLDNNDDDNELDGESELLAALKSLKDSDDEDDIDEDDIDESDDDNDDDNADEDLENEDDLDSDDELDVDNDDDDTTKKVQSKEDNAKFAAKRREAELQKRVDAELAKIREEAPEFALAKQLSEMYGIPAEQLVEQMKEANLQKQAEEMKVPVEVLRKQQESDSRADKLEAELNQIRFESWQNKIKSESVKLQEDFKMLSEEDITSAVDYILYEAQNVDMSLEEAVYAKHGKKIIDNLVKDKTQDKLASESGRKRKTPPSPNNGKTVKTATLSKEEQYMAKALGMSDADYLKYK